MPDAKMIFLILHVLFMAIGVGSATIADAFFFKFLRDYTISKFEADVLSHLSKFLWVAVVGIVLSGLALFIPEASEFLSRSKFVAKMVIVLILVLNGAALNLFVAPRLVKMSFDKRRAHHHQPGELRRSRRLAFALGPISIVSWYSAFILGMLNGLPLTVIQILGIYVAFCLVGIACGQCTERMLVRAASR